MFVFPINQACSVGLIANMKETLLLTIVIKVNMDFLKVSTEAGHGGACL